MRLIRRDKSFTSDPENPNDYMETEYFFETDELEERLRVNFPDFGRGKERRPGFSVEVDWQDVTGFLMAFYRNGEPRRCLYSQPS